MEFSREKIIDLFENAFAKLFANDLYLLQICVSERCIMARIAMYIEQQLRDEGETELNVDVEYNRHIENPKVNISNKRYIPDLIIHKRGNNYCNICCCEAKKRYNKYRDKDNEKIKTQMKELQYQYGIVIKKMNAEGVEYLLYHAQREISLQYPRK